MAAHWRVALLVCVTTLIWIGYYERWTFSSWSIPTDYRGDSLEILARIKAAAEGDTVPLRPQVISRLGAPFGANWSAYPSSDLLLVWSLGVLAKLTGVNAAANIGLLLATLTAALAFYGTARWLQARWEWAFAGAVLFAFTFQTFHRGLAHLFIVYSWTVPLVLLSAGVVAASRQLQLHSRLGLFCVLTSVVVGVGNPYILFLHLQLVGWALIAQWIGDRRRENIVTGLAMIGAAAAAFLIVESHLWLFTPDSAAASPIVRNYGGTERYALKPLELLLPPAWHRWDVLAFFGQRYVRWSDWRTGESFAPYLGLIAIGGLAWLGAVAFRAVLRRERVPGIALPAVWVLVFASVGGVTNVLAFFTSMTVFRATNRYSIFISAVVLLFIVMRMTRWWNGKRAWLSYGAAALVMGFGLADQLPPRIESGRKERIATRVQSDRDLGKRLEQELPSGAMVFQLPVLGFPEVVPPHQLGDYEYFRPYLSTETLRFTYGSLKGRSRGRWQRDTAELPAKEMVRELERYGFSAIYLNRRGFPDRGEKLLAELSAAGRTRRIEGKLGEQVVVVLEPSRSPVIPTARNLTFGRGWHEARSGEPRWAFGPALLSYYNPYGRPVRGELRIALSAVRTRNVTIQLNQKDLLNVELGETRRDFRVPVTINPGFNRFRIASEEPPLRVSAERDSLRSVAVFGAEMRLTLEEGEPAAEGPISTVL